MQPTLMSQGLELLLFGMGTVVVFLTVLVYAIRLMSLLIQRFFPAPMLVKTSSALSAADVSGSAGASSSDISPQILAAIVGAVHQHRESSSGSNKS